MSVRTELPDLHRAAGRLSDTKQRTFLWLVRGEYGFLLIAAVLAMEFSDDPLYYVAYTVVLVAGLGVLLVRSLMRPEQQWYRARAAAESVKTMAWRFMMRAHPYEGTDDVAARATFLAYLRQIVSTNKALAQGGFSTEVGSEQVTASMRDVRSMALARRTEFYLEQRVKDQQAWYVRKAKGNRRAFKAWVTASVFAYGNAILLAVLRIAVPPWHHWPIEPLILFASFVIGWVQIKKHSELAASYTLTAAEIGLAKEEGQNISTEDAFSDYVNDTELVFSREHTQWVARQETAG